MTKQPAPIERRRRRIDTSQRHVPGGTFVFDYYSREQKPIWGDGADVLWMPGEPTMLVAPEGTGKSSLAQQLALRRIGVIADATFLNFTVERLRSNERVLYLAMDRPRQIARSLRRMVELSDRRKLDTRLSVWLGPPPVDVRGSAQTFAAWIEAEYPHSRDIVIDSLKDLAMGLSDDETGAAVNSSIQELIARGHNVLTLHHNRKSGRDESQRQRSLDHVYGSRWLTGGHGSVIWLDGKPGATVIDVVHLKPIANLVPKFRVVHNHMRGASTVYRGEPDVIELLIAHREDGITLEQAALHLFKTRSDSDKQRARRALTNLVREGIARYEPGAAGGSGGGGREGRWFPIEH